MPRYVNIDDIREKLIKLIAAEYGYGCVDMVEKDIDEILTNTRKIVIETIGGDTGD